MRKAAEALVAGLGAGAVIEFIVLTLYVPVNFERLFGVPAYALVHAFAAAMFVALLLVFLKTLRVEIPTFRVAALALYALSGLVPLVMVFSVEVLSESISLFMQYRDPSNHYTVAAVLFLLSSEHTSLFLRVRVWVAAFLIIGIFVYYIFVHLRRLLTLCSGMAPAAFRIVLALLLTVAVQNALFYYLLGRIYWLTIGALIK